MRTFLIAAAALAVAAAVPAFARATESFTEPDRQTMQMPNLPPEAQAAGTTQQAAPEAAPIVEARRMQRR